MNALPAVDPADSAQIVALLCVPDSGEEPSPTLAQHFGQPLLHHLIKALEAKGITRFFIGVDSIPGAMLRYVDSARSVGLDIGFVRNPGELAARIEDSSIILVQSADTYIDSNLLEQALGVQQPLLATVEEQTENQRFERIDLNSRWAGLAVLKKRNLAALTQLPDGWDMGSALLRQALQDGVSRWPIAQKHVQAGALRKLNHADALQGEQLNTGRFSDDSQKTLESYIFSPLARRILPGVWRTTWSRPLTEWLFPVAAVTSFGATTMKFPLVGAAAAIASIFAAVLRRHVHTVEYRSDKTDWLGTVGWAVLALTLGGLLFHTELSRAEGVFVWLVVLGLSIFGKNYWNKKQIWLSSPLVIALVAAFGAIAGEAGWAVRALVLAELGALLMSKFRVGKNPEN